LVGGVLRVTAADVLLNVTPSMLSGPLAFIGSPGGLTFANPVPYGIVNNINDNGWIWPSDNSGRLVVDFGAPVGLSKFRAYSTYNGGSRGANWAIEHSSNNNDWTQSTNFPFVTTLLGGVDDQGAPIAGFGGWYEISFNPEGSEDRYWRIRQTQVLVLHAPRCGQFAFYAPSSLPSVKSASPKNEKVRSDANILIELEDGLGAPVAPATIQLSVNGQAVAPVIDPAIFSSVTTVSYDPPGTLPVGSNSYRIVFGDESVPPVLQTNSYSFSVVPDEFCAVTPAMLSGSLTFFASPGGLTHSAPIPYGIPNNAADVGWIWVNDSYLDVNFGESIALARFRVYASYPGAAYGAVWAIEVSSDGVLYESVADFVYQNSPGGGVNDDGSRRSDMSGWYEAAFNQNGAKSGQYWRVRQTGVTIAHAPRSAEMEFYKAVQNPTVKSFGPSGDGAKGDAVIRVELQDNLTAVVPGSIQLSLNGETVSPTIEKPPGSLVTTVSYDPPGDLPVGVYTIRTQFANDAVPPVVQTHEFTFKVAPLPLPVCPAMLSGPLNFLASPAGLTFSAPIPYGIVNNVADNGWIWPSDNSGVLNVDFGAPAAVNRFRVFVSYAGTSRGANWAIEYSNDNVTWSLATDFVFITTAGGGINDDFSPRSDFGGWYQAAFNADGMIGARYWRVRQTEVLVAHAPRCAQVEFYGALIMPLPVTPAMLSGPLNFYASPAGLTFNDPIPYGIVNNAADNGWIWPRDNSGLLQVDFGQAQVVNMFRVYSTYGGAGKGAIWAIERSEDAANWTPVTDFTFETRTGGGLNDDGCTRSDDAGWYGTSFNDTRAAARYWRIRQTQVTVEHPPRCGQVEFFAFSVPPSLELTFTKEGGSLTLSWADPTDTAVLQWTGDVHSGEWHDLLDAVSPYPVTMSETMRFYRLRR